MDKERGEIHYENRIRNKKAFKYRPVWYIKGGNSYSVKKSCPTAHESGTSRAAYLVEKRNLDIPDHRPARICLKDSAKVMRSGGTLPAGPNQFHDRKVDAEPAPRPTRPADPRHCNLNQILPHLHIANLDYIESRHIDGIVINLTDKVQHRTNSGYHYRRKVDRFNVGFRDCRQITRGQFERIYAICRDIVERSGVRDIYLVCNRGVNRSVSIAVQLAIDRGMSYERAVEYIIQEKQLQCGDWDTLTNPRLRRILQTKSREQLGAGN